MSKLIQLIPTLFTSLNALLGYYSIYFSFYHFYVYAGLSIFIATIFDLFDGRLARILKVHNSVGKEMDSFADFLSFGVAPSILIVNIAKDYFSLQSIPLEYLYFIGFIYTLAVAIRLAMFNNPKGTYISRVPKKTPTDFVGIPSTLAGGFIGFMAIYHTGYQGLFRVSHFNFQMHPVLIIFIMLTLSYLMLAPISFPKIAHFLFNFNTVYGIASNIAFLIVFILVGNLVFAISTFSYIFIPPILFFIKKKNYKVYDA